MAKETKTEAVAVAEPKEKIALAAYLAALRDPSRKDLALALVAKSEAGEDTSKELGALLGIDS